MKMKINRLPAGTWRWLRMNEACVSQTADLTEEPAKLLCPETVVCRQEEIQEFERIETGMGADMTRLLQGSGLNAGVFCTQEGKAEEKPLSFSFRYRDGDRKGNRIDLCLRKRSRLTVIMDYGSDKGSGLAALQTRIVAQEHAHLTLVQIQRLGEGFSCFNDIGAVCREGASVELVQLVMGGRDVWMGCRAELAGTASDLKASIGYQVSGHRSLDMNYAAVHEGRKTTSHIEANGVLRDQAKKLFRGTIDFKKGAAGAKGDELEDVLLLDDEVENKTIPLILCAEEDVEGNHGASIGGLDEEQLFYLEARGISEEAARELMARARLKAVCRRIPQQALREELETMIDGEREEPDV